MTPEPNSKPRKSPRSKVLVLLVLIVIAGGVGWTLIAQAASIRVYVIPSSSMAPIIQAGDKVAVRLERVSPGTVDAPHRGEFWIFALPANGNNAPPNPAIKRVIGLPGETIAVQNGKVLINGKPLEESYLAAPMTYTMEPLILGRTEYFLLGDNRNASLDSSKFGPVPANQMIGRAIYRVWPLERAGNL